jgi:hypothetical protein
LRNLQTVVDHQAKPYIPFKENKRHYSMHVAPTFGFNHDWFLLQIGSANILRVDEKALAARTTKAHLKTQRDCSL